MRPRVLSEMKNDQIGHLLDRLRNSGTAFIDWPRQMLDKLRDHFKFLLFKPKQQLTKRGEPVDFVGFIVQGSANVILEHKSQACLQAGDAIGYMSAIGLAGCEVQQFDIYGKEAGCMALIRREDLRLLIKRDPEFTHYLYVNLALRTLNAVNQQYHDKNYQFKKPQHFQECTVKKVLLYLDQLALTTTEIQALAKSSRRSTLPVAQNFRYFWNTLEQRDKRLFAQTCNQIDLQPNDSLSVDGQVGGCFYVVVYGDLMSDKQKIPLKPGDVVGLKEFFTQDAFRERIVARTKCVLIRLTRQQLNDMFQVSPSGAANVLSMLTRYESHRIRERFEEEFPKERIHLQHQVEYLFEKMHDSQPKAQFSVIQVMQHYFELAISKTALLELDLVEPEVQQSNIAPLYVLDTFKELVAKRGYQSNEIKDRKDPMLVSGMSWFLREKAEEQHLASVKQREEERKQKKAGTFQAPPEEQEKSAERDLFEELNNETYLLKGELAKAHEYIYLLEERLQQQKEQARSKFEDNEMLRQKLRKYEMHQELLKLNLHEQLTEHHHTMAQRTTPYDTFKIHAQDARRFKKTIQAADTLMMRSQFK